MSTQNLNETELVIYNSFMDKWKRTLEAAGPEALSNFFADREGSFTQIYNEILNDTGDDTSSLHVALALIDDIPALASAESLKSGVVGGNGKSENNLSLRKTSWDNGGQKSEDYHPGSNTGPIPYKMPKHPGDIPRESPTTLENYFNKSILEREDEEHAGVSNREQPGSGAQSQGGDEPGKIDNIYPEPSNKLRPFKHMPIPPERFRQDFNTGFDTEYVQRQYGELSLRREKRADEINPQGLENVCAWCKSLYDPTTGMPIRPLSEEEYGLVISHGICKSCADQQIAELRARKKAFVDPYRAPEDPYDRYNQLWYKHIMKTLTNPTTTEDVIWKLVVEHSMSPDVLALALEHPNLKDPSKKGTIQQWLSDIDNKTVKDFENTEVSDGSYEEWSDTQNGIDVPMATEDDFGQEIIPQQQNTFEFPPESDERREQRREAPRLTEEEAIMLESHTSDEIWDLYRTQSSPVAQSLIEKGIVATLKRMKRNALLSWTPAAEDILNTTTNPRTRQLWALIKREVDAGNLNSVNDFGRVIFDEFPEYSGNAPELRRLYSHLVSQGYLNDSQYTPEVQNKWWLTEEQPVDPFLLPHTPRFTNPYGGGIPLEQPELEPEKVSWWKKLFSSVLDAPRDVLDPAIWQTGPNDIPIIKPHIKVEIVERFFAYLNRFAGYVNPELWVKNMFYTGSTATYKYSDHSDIDIHVVIDWQDMLEANPDKKRSSNEEVWRELHDTFWWTLNSQKLPGTKHPIQYYVVKPGEEKSILAQKEEIYDIGHDVWLIPPEKRVEVPEEVLQLAIVNAKDIMHRIDDSMSSAKQSLIDYALLTEIITPENAKHVYALLAEKIHQIDEHLKEMKDEYAKLKQSRQEVFTDHTVNNNFSLENVTFKLVERYKYLDVLRKLKRLTDSLDLKPDQVPDVANILGLEDVFE